MTQYIVSVSARPRMVGYMVVVECCYCHSLHRHQWRRSDPAPGLKTPGCKPRGGAKYFVDAPEWLRDAPGEQVARARSALRSLDISRVVDQYLRQQIVVACASLADAVDQAGEAT